MVTSFIHTTYGIENWKHDTHLTCLWWILIRRTVSFRQEGLTSMLQSLFATVEWSQWTIGDCQPHPGPYRQVTSIRPQSNLGVVNVPATRKKKRWKSQRYGLLNPVRSYGLCCSTIFYRTSYCFWRYRTPVYSAIRSVGSAHRFFTAGYLSDMGPNV